MTQQEKEFIKWLAEQVEGPFYTFPSSGASPEDIAFVRGMEHLADEIKKKMGETFGVSPS